LVAPLRFGAASSVKAIASSVPRSFIRQGVLGACSCLCHLFPDDAPVLCASARFRAHIGGLGAFAAGVGAVGAIGAIGETPGVGAIAWTGAARHSFLRSISRSPSLSSTARTEWTASLARSLRALASVGGTLCCSTVVSAWTTILKVMALRCAYGRSRLARCSSSARRSSSMRVLRSSSYRHIG
jgi:hypothetical protein